MKILITLILSSIMIAGNITSSENHIQTNENISPVSRLEYDSGMPFLKIGETEYPFVGYEFNPYQQLYILTPLGNRIPVTADSNFTFRFNLPGNEVNEPGYISLTVVDENDNIITVGSFQCIE